MRALRLVAVIAAMTGVGLASGCDSYDVGLLDPVGGSAMLPEQGSTEGTAPSPSPSGSGTSGSGSAPSAQPGAQTGSPDEPNVPMGGEAGGGSSVPAPSVDSMSDAQVEPGPVQDAGSGDDAGSPATQPDPQPEPDASTPIDAGIPEDTGTPEDTGPSCTPSNGGVESCDQRDNDCDGRIDEGEVCAPPDPLAECVAKTPSYRGAACDACVCEHCGPELDACQLSEDENTAQLCNDLVECHVINQCVDCYMNGSGPCTGEIYLAAGGTSETDSSQVTRCTNNPPDNACAHGASYRVCKDANCADVCP